MKRLCVEPGCSEVIAKGSRCASHGAAHKARRARQLAGINSPEYKRKRRLARDGGSGHRGQVARRRILDRDGHQCVICGSAGPLEVDHIVPVALGGSNDDSNKRTLCKPCHKAHGATGRRKGEMSPDAPWTG